MKRIGLTLMAISLVALQLYSQNVNIPDAKFLAALIDDGVDTDEDGQISYAEAEMVAKMNVRQRGITNMTGIEAFVNLLTLECIGNYITGLDVSKNTKLKKLLCEGNHLSSLDVSNCFNLTGLDCSVNQLTSLDVSACLNLTDLDCSGNLLYTLDISEIQGLLKCQSDHYFGTTCSHLNLSNMPTLRLVCVSNLPFPDEGLDSLLNTKGSPNTYFTTECSDVEAPDIIAEDSLYQADYIEAISSEDGVIYLVPENTVTHLGLIRALCIDSVVVVSNTPANISLSAQDNGIYWLYARDSSGNISEPKTIAVMGVGIQLSRINQIRIYPNPTKDLVTIETDHSECYSMEITSLKGQQILIGEIEGTTHQIYLSKLQKGVYIITIRSKNFVKTEKIIKL